MLSWLNRQCAPTGDGSPAPVMQMLAAVFLATALFAGACSPVPRGAGGDSPQARSTGATPSSETPSGLARPGGGAVSPVPSALPPGASPSPFPLATRTPVAPVASAAGVPGTPTGHAVTVSRGDPNQRSVYLTFDAGSDAGFTAQILDSLKAQGVYATFGLTGLWAQQNPDLVRRIAGDGHLVINHTYDHRSFTGVSTHSAPLSAPERTTEIEHAEAVLTALTGQTTKPWFRPPYGDFDASVTADAMAAGYDHVALWTVDSLGWQGLSVPAIQQRCLTRAVPGAIYLFHVGSQSHDAQALPAIIDSLRVQNYSFATMAALATQR